MTPETPKQPEEMPETTYPEELFIECRFTDDGDINRITFGNVRYIRADLAAKPDKVDVEALKREVIMAVDNDRHNNLSIDAGAAIAEAIDHLYSRNLIPPVEPVRRDVDVTAIYEGWYIPFSSMSGPARKTFRDMMDIIKRGGQVDVAARCDGKDYRWECDGLKYAKPSPNPYKYTALTQSPAPDLSKAIAEHTDKIVERLEGLRRKYEPMVDFDLVAIEASNDTLDAALELIKQARG